MKTIRKRWQRLPVPLRAIINVLGIVLTVFILYVTIGCPPFSVRDAYRRAEKANLVGPSDILAQISPENTPYDHLVLASDETSVTLFSYSRKTGGELVYLKKDGNLTLAAAPDNTFYPLESKAVIPVVLFDNVPNAQRAEVELSLSTMWQDVPYQKTYILSAERTKPGCFLFTIEARGTPTLGGEGMLLQTLLQVTGNSMADTVNLSIPALVRLYDETNTLMTATHLTIQSAAGKLAHNP